MEHSNNFVNINNDNNVLSPTKMGQSLPGSYYSVYVPGDIKPQGSTICKYIFEDKDEALKMVKKSKKARFKHFVYIHEAIRFAVNGLEQPQNNKNAKNMDTPQVTVLGEKPSPFKGPKPQELVKLRKAIECGDYEFVLKTVWENPRCLVSSGDTPSILQEGSRYNALHVAAKAKNSTIAELILNTISDVNFVKYLYGDDNCENAENRTQMLLDLYLNTPDKGLNETPLHFAVKFGALQVVEVLVSFPQCDKNLKNKFDQTPDMIICDRCDKNESTVQLKKKMKLLLENSYYVPVLRAEDNSMPPIIGEPFSPTKPPIFNDNPLNPRLEIHAYAGPMNKKGADTFRKVWKTPPRTNMSSPIKTKQQTEENSGDNDDVLNKLRYKDPEKGLERIGQNLANKFEVNWKEYWPFLDSFVDITSVEGLNLLENYLASRYNNSLEIYQTNFSIPKTDSSSLSELCSALESCNLNDIKSDEIDDNDNSNNSNLNPFLCVERACEVFANRISNDIVNIICNDYTNIIQVLETEIKQLELLVLSYMEDYRFANINFQSVHSRLGLLICNKLITTTIIDKLIKFLESYTKSLDCFSSDDEDMYLKETKINIKPTTTKKQLICLIRFIKNNLNDCNNEIQQIQTENDCIEIWRNMKECQCIFNVKKVKKNSRNSFKHNIKMSNIKLDISRKLNFNDEVSDAINDETDDHSSSDEEFFTPPISPTKILDSISDNEDDEYCDTEAFIEEYFIDCFSPTKTDNAVYNALLHSNCVVDPTEYPYVYRWRHTISLYSDIERERWPCPSINRISDNTEISPTITSTPTRCSNISSSDTTPPSRSWLRITGANSPRAILKQKIV